MIDPAVARRVVNQRFGPAALMARNSIRDEDWVDSMLSLADSGTTHDEEAVRLYREMES